MGLLGKSVPASSAVVAYYGHGRAAARSAGSMMSRLLLSTATTHSQSRTPSRTCHADGHPSGASVLYVDRGVIVLNKPPGLVSQGTTTTATSESSIAPVATSRSPPKTAFDDVLDGLRRAYGLSANPYPVHRLDKGTTGVLVLARTKQLARELSQQFRARAIDKSYLALVLHLDGDADADADAGTRSFFPAKEGLIDAPLGFNDGRVRSHVQAQAGGSGSVNGSGAVAQALPTADSELGLGSKAARTRWEVLASSNIAPVSLVRLYPHTGLKHQLRVHMAHILKVPILGDALYGGATTPSTHFFSTYAGIPEGRLFLHSSSISFWRYRRKGLRKRFRLTISAPLPADFVKICRDMNLSLPEDIIKGGAFIDGQRLLGGEITDVEGRWLGSSP